MKLRKLTYGDLLLSNSFFRVSRSRAAGVDLKETVDIFRHSRLGVSLRFRKEEWLVGARR